jgi:hypothetical protein
MKDQPTYYDELHHDREEDNSHVDCRSRVCPYLDTINRYYALF